MSQDKPLYVTQPTLPPLEEFLPYLERIWQSKILTNCGPFHEELEGALCDYLGVKHVSLFSNGTNALLVSLQALEISGEVITTPYSFVATANSLLWRGIDPVFVDIDPVTLNLDPGRIEAAITPRTTAIMPVHCYGHPCDVERIQAIAKARKLKVIYDAAHAFGVRSASASLLSFGDLSMLSFHATKVFNTFEGGAIVSQDAAMKERIDKLRNFGFEDEVTVVSAGINSKMSEFNAALGLLQLKGLKDAVERRKAIATRYREGLAGMKGIQCVAPMTQWTPNHGYFPVMVMPDFPISRDALYEKLQESNIYTRRYFYPLISDFPMYKDLPSAAHANLPVARTAASRVLCLPMSANMHLRDADRVIARVAEARRA